MASIGSSTSTPISTSSSSAASSASSASTLNGLQSLDANQFLKIIVAELQNQDPTQPMDNTQLAQQMGQIQSLTATTKLSSAVDTLQSGQSLTAASSLIGKKVQALTDAGDTVSGTVDKVTVDTSGGTSGKSFRLHIGDQNVSLNNVREVTP